MVWLANLLRGPDAVPLLQESGLRTRYPFGSAFRCVLTRNVASCIKALIVRHYALVSQQLQAALAEGEEELWSPCC